MISVSESGVGGSLVEEVREVFSRSGVLSKSKDFEYRPQQEEMAGAVANGKLLC